MSKVKFVQDGDKISFEAYGKTIAIKEDNKWVNTKLITPELANQLKERIKNENII
jgi:hypothetical protein